jgi:thioredoxin-like negative regulator of GroEL
MFLKVDVDKCPGTAAANNVSAMPTFVFFRNRTELERLRGADKAALESKVNQHSSAPSGGQAGEAGGSGDVKEGPGGEFVIKIYDLKLNSLFFFLFYLIKKRWTW